MAAASAVERHLDSLLTHDTVIIVLAHLRQRDARRPRDLRRHVGVTTGGMSNILGRMEAADLIRRSTMTDRGDDRGVLVELTPAGAEAERVVIATLHNALRQTSAVLKELLLLLEHLGARTPVRRAPVAREASIGLTLVMALTQIGAQLTRGLEAPPLDATSSIVLIAIADVGPCRPRYLADRIGLTSAGVAKILDRLEHEGLIGREGGSKPLGDQRAVYVHLTRQGENVVTELVTGFDGHVDALASAVQELTATLSVELPADPWAKRTIRGHPSPAE